MNFRRANFRLPWVAVMLPAALLSAAAQDGATPSGKAIIFSAPAGDHSISNAPLLTPQLPERPDFARELRAPSPIFDMQQPPSPAPALPRAPSLSRTEMDRLRRTLDVRENWALMTPAEILGVDAGKGSGTQQEGSDDQKHLTVLERYLERQQKSHMPATNEYHGSNPLSDWGFSGTQGGVTNTSQSDSISNGLPAASQILSRFFNDLHANNPFAEQEKDRNGEWFSSLGLPPQPAPPTPEQLAEKERFRQLLEPGSFSDTPAKSVPGGKFLSSLQPLSGPTSEQTPTVNPVGNSYAPLASGFGRPTGLTPLPGITTTPVGSPSSALPAWAPQPPPWLSQTPQPFTVPQRKF